jgi:hypothetical protein
MKQCTNLKIEKCSLFVDSEKRFLVASPNGLIGATSVVEVKCIETKKIDYCTIAAIQK